MNFRTSYLNEATGEEIFNSKMIAIQYMKARFWVDMLASIPFDLVIIVLAIDENNTTIFQMFGLLKLIRVLRLSRLIVYLNLKDDIQMSLKLVKLIFFLIMYLHCWACMWYYLVQDDEEWIPPLDYVWLETDIYDETAFMKY